MSFTQMVLLLAIFLLGLTTQLVLTQIDFSNDDFDQADNYESKSVNEKIAEIERQEMHELRKLLGQGLVEKQIEPEPTKETIKLKKPSRKIKGPKYDDSEESEESLESEEVDEEEDPAEDFEYDPWKHQYHDIFPDGTYVYGYALPHGVRRYEKSSQSIHGLVVEGFYTQPRYHQHHLVYELRCYRADHNGYRPFPVEYLKHPPTVQRDEAPGVDCFN